VYGMGFGRSSYQGHQYVEHAGADLGFMSEIIRYPNDGLGIAVLTNDVPRGYLAAQIISWRVAEKLLGLPHADWRTRTREQHYATMAEAERQKSLRWPPPDDAPPPSVDISALSGTYYDPGYGNLTLLETSSDGLALESAPFVTAIGNLTFALAHYSRDVFNLTLSLTLDDLDGQSQYLGESYMNIEFGYKEDDDLAVVAGLGIQGGFWGAGPGIMRPQGETPEDRAEVWFSRI